ANGGEDVQIVFGSLEMSDDFGSGGVRGVGRQDGDLGNGCVGRAALGEEMDHYEDRRDDDRDHQNRDEEVAALGLREGRVGHSSLWWIADKDSSGGGSRAGFEVRVRRTRKTHGTSSACWDAAIFVVDRGAAESAAAGVDGAERAGDEPAS